MAFDPQPLLTSDMVILRPLHSDDFEDLHVVASDPQLWELHPSTDRADERVFRIWFDEALASGGALVAVDAVSSETIGTSRFVQHSDQAVEIGWTFLARSRWGGEWNGEMKRLMLRHAFASVPEVLFKVHSANTRSQRAVLRLGATQVGTEVDHHGRGQNLVYRLRRP